MRYGGIYREKDSYGNEVLRLARPLPVEYLLVDIPASTPLTPQYTFNADSNLTPFPVENRMVDGHIQDFNALSNYCQQFRPGHFLEAVSDFHFLLYISAMDMLPMKDYMSPILEAVRTKNSDLAENWSRSEHWATVEQLITASSSSLPTLSRHVALNNATGPNIGDQDEAAAPNGILWTCPHCTFLNPPELATCEMCSLPR